MSDTKVDDIQHHEPMRHRSLTTVTLTAEQFESLYLQPKNATTSGNMASQFANPTPLGMAAFLLAFLPLSMDLLNFQGASSTSATVLTGVFYGVAGIGLYIAAIMEFICGNTFPMVVFGAFGGFWISYGVIVQPTFVLASAFAPNAANATEAQIQGALSPEYNSGIALYLVAWLVLGIMFFLASLRTNLCFSIVFLCLNCLVGCLIAAFIHLGHGKFARATNEFKAAGAFGFVGSIAGWYVTLSMLLASTGYPFSVPLVDLSGRVLTGKRKDAEKQA